MVTSPGGTSAAAIHELESGRLRTVFSEAVWAAYRRTVELGEQLEVQRVTLRLPSDASLFPVAYEWCAPGVHSIRDTPRLDMSKQPVVLKMQAGASQVVEDDCATATDDAGYHGGYADDREGYSEGHGA